MASMTKAQLATAVIEHMGVVAAGQTPAAADQALVEAVVDRVFARLQALNLIAFAVSAIPEWAQQQMIDLVAKDAAPPFGPSSEQMILYGTNARRAELDLQRQLAGSQQATTVEREYY